MQDVREPAVAGSFYPVDGKELAALVDSLLERAPTRASSPKALIVPHAGYVYSGAIAAAGFALVPRDSIDRVVLVGPAHRVFVDGLAWPDARRMKTPLGEVEVDVGAIRSIAELAPNARAHAREHCLEVELPFLQRVAPRARLIPLIGSQPAADLGHVLETLWGGPETLIVISSDLTHYLPYATARSIDRETASQILALGPELSDDRACGAGAINGLLWVARRKAMRAELVDLRNSGDTAGARDEVVGYGAFALYETA